MKEEFKKGLVVRPKKPGDRFTNGCTRATLLNYEGEGFYRIQVGNSEPLITHEDDVELAADLRKLLDSVESAGRVWDDSQQDIKEAQDDALREEVKALKELVVALTKAVLDGS